MKTYKEILKKYKQEDKIYCNLCGNEILKTPAGTFYDYLHVEKTWGYDSEKDGREDSFDLCEECYDNLVKQFKFKIGG